MIPRTFKTVSALKAFLARQRGVVLHLEILHDDDARCTPSRCVCRPWYRVSEATAEGLVEGERAEREWLAEGVN